MDIQLCSLAVFSNYSGTVCIFNGTVIQGPLFGQLWPMFQSLESERVNVKESVS